MNINRRNLFKGMVAASALPRFNVGCAGFGLSRERRIAQGAKIRVALIGCGLQTRCMIDGVLCEDLVAIVDPDPVRLAFLEKYVADTCDAEARANFATARRFSTYQDMFEQMDGEIDAIVVETPSHPQLLPAGMALRGDIHVYLEKPLCLTSAECHLILAEARRRPHLVTQCGTYGHSFPSMTYCRVYGTPSFNPSHQCNDSSPCSRVAGKWNSNASRYAHAPSSANFASWQVTRSGSLSPSAQNATSMMCMPRLPIEPLP